MKRWIVLVLTIVPLVAQAGIMEFLSQAAHTISPGSERCEAVERERVRAALTSAEEHCRSRTESLGVERNVADLVDVGERAQAPREDELENRFFSLLAEENRRQLLCSSDFADEIQGNAEAMTLLRERFLSLRAAKRLLTQKVQLISSPNYSGPRVCPSSLQDLSPNPALVAAFGQDQGYEVCSSVIEARLAVRVIEQSLPLVGAPAVADLAARIDGISDLNDSGLDRLIRQAYAGARDSIRSDANRIQETLRTEGGRGFGRSDRYALMSDPVLVDRIVNSAADRDAVKSIACRANARYGDGADRLHRGILVGSFLLGGGLVGAARLGIMGARLSFGLNAARTAGTLSYGGSTMLQTATVGLAGAAAGTGGLAIVERADRDCFAGTPQVRPSANACVGSPQLGQMQRDHCVLSSILSRFRIGRDLMVGRLRSNDSDK